MPIYEETYRSWHGQLIPDPRTWLIIARTGIRLHWKRAMIFTLLLASTPFLLRVGQIYASTRLADYPELAQMTSDLTIDADLFAGFLQGQGFFVFLVLIIAGAGQIANDRRFRALSIYFSRPVFFRDYIAGKFLIVGWYGALVTLIPALLLFLITVLLSTDGTFFSDYWWVPFSIMGQSALILLSLGGIILALSAVTGRARSAAVLLFGLLLIPEMIRGILSGIPWLGYGSLQALFRQSNALLFNRELPFEFSAWIGMAVLLGYAGLSLYILWQRVRPTEVVR
ncbi:hypothetical protein ACFL6R_04965 [Gemmatimonadota bacterium]